MAIDLDEVKANLEAWRSYRAKCVVLVQQPLPADRCFRDLEKLLAEVQVLRDAVKERDRLLLELDGLED